MSVALNARRCSIALAFILLAGCGQELSSPAAPAAPAPISQAPAPQDGAVSADAARYVVRLAPGSTDPAQAKTAMSPEQRFLQLQTELVQTRMQKPGAAEPVQFKPMRTLGTGAVLVTAPAGTPAEEAEALAATLAADVRVLSVERDVRVSTLQVGGPEAVTNDPALSLQWALRPRSAVPGGAAFRSAWARTRGEGVTVAVLDTGHLAHPDLVANSLPGYDFVTDLTIAGDGNGRDADPTDPGDFCNGRASSWHGVAVASEIVGIADNSYGIAGGAPQAKVVPVRVLGRCGGWLSDTADAIAWVAGVNVPGVPPLGRKVQVANLSLGASGACPRYMQDAVTAAVQAGVTVVAAAGNEALNGVSSPANCVGAIAVGAHNASADLANYSNHGPGVTLTAPGGGACMRSLLSPCDSTPVVTAGVNGTTTFTGYLDRRAFNGTSAAAPHVAAAAALLYAAKPSITPAEVRSALVTSATRHATGGFCASNPGLCGAGMLDAAGALAQISDTPLVQLEYGTGITPSTQSATAPGLIARGRSGSLLARVGGLPQASFAWRQTGGAAATITGGTTGSSLSFTAPQVSGLLSFEVTASSGTRQAKNTITVMVNNAPTLPASLPGARVRAPYTFAFATRDADGDTLTYALTSAPAGMTLSSTGALSWPQPSGTLVDVAVRVSDPLGQSAVQSYRLNVANQVPVITMASSARVVAGTALSVPVRAVDPDGSAVTISLLNAPAGMLLGNGAISWPRPTPGRFTVTVQARDAEGGTAQAPLTIEVVQGNRAPVVGNTVISGSSTTGISGMVQAADPDGDRLSFAVVGAVPAGFSLDGATGRFTWSMPRVGSTVVTVLVRDPAGLSAQGTLTFNIGSANRAPIVPSVTIVTRPGTTINLTIPVMDPEGDAVTLSLSGAPAGMSLSNAGVLRWDRTVAGSYRFTITARDARGAVGTGTVVMTVN
jgi:serine protease